MWVAQAATFAENARRLRVPTTAFLEGHMLRLDRKAWQFKITYGWIAEAGLLEASPTITKRGRLVKVEVRPDAPKLQPDSPFGLEQVTAYEEASVKQALDAYLKQYTPRS